MAKRKRYPTKNPPSHKGNRSSQSFEQILDQAGDYLEQNNPEMALSLLESLSDRQQNHPDAVYTRGMANLMMGYEIEGLVDLEAASRRMKGFPPVFLNLAIVCTRLAWLRHAWHYAELYLKKKPQDPEGEQIAREIIEKSKEIIAAHATDLGVSTKTMARASFPHERAQIQLNQGRYDKVLKETKSAIRMLPEWPSPRNNRTMAYIFMGRIKDAEREAQDVLQKIDAENEHALGNLIKIYTSTLEFERARPYAEKLIVVIEKSADDDLDISRVVETLAEWEDHQALWNYGQRVLEMIDEIFLPPSTWYQIGAAAANTKNWSQAHQCFQRSQRQGGYIEQWLEIGLKVTKQAKRSKQSVSGPGLDGKFQYFPFTHYFNEHLAEEFFSLAEMELGSEQMTRFMQRYPFLAGAYRLLLWSDGDEIMRESALNGLAACKTPGAYAELKRFATSSYGEDGERLMALRLLTEAGQHDATEPVPFWLADKQEWTEVLFKELEISDPEEPPCGPDVMALMMQSSDAAHDGDLERAAALLEKAVELEPDCAQAVHNLGAQYMNLGKKEEGEALIRRSVEIDPNYLFGYTTLAELALVQEDYETCQEHLKPIFASSHIFPEVMRRALEIQLHLGLELDEKDVSQKALETLKELYPEDPEIERFETLINIFGMEQAWAERWLSDVHRYRLRKLKQSISADAPLSDCLDRVSSENLVGTLKFWGLSTSGRKAVRIARLVETITDIDDLTEFVNDDLEAEERAALAWLLSGDGIRPWEEFTAKFGDDFDESPYWQWHNPETVPGCLRMFGVLAVGTLDGQRVALIPADLRPLLHQALATQKGDSAHE